MKLTHISLALSTTLLAALFSIGAGKAAAQAAAAIPPVITTPDKVESRLGVLEFKDGAPSAATVEKVYDTLDFIRGVDAFLNSYGGASAYAIREGFLSIGANDNSVVLYSELMDFEFAISHAQRRHRLLHGCR